MTADSFREQLLPYIEEFSKQLATETGDWAVIRI